MKQLDIWALVIAVIGIIVLIYDYVVNQVLTDMIGWIGWILVVVGIIIWVVGMMKKK